MPAQGGLVLPDSLAPLPGNNLNPVISIPGDQDEDKSDATPDPMNDPIFLSLSKDMQDELLREADAFHKECEMKPAYAAKHSCDCLSLHYLDERLKQPDRPPGSIPNDIVNECVDIVSTAGYAYNKCLKIYATIYKDNLKQLCECYGRRFARSYADNPGTNSDYEINLGSTVMLSCRARYNPLMPQIQEPPRTLPDLENLKP